MQRSSSESTTFWSIIVLVVVADFATKAMAASMLVPQHVPREVFGEWARLTLVHNPGAAFGVSAGPYSRQIFLLLTVVALFVLSNIGSVVHFAHRFAGITSTARSCALSTTSLRAYTFVLLSVITRTSSAPSSRCAFVSTSPDESARKPVPRWLPYTVNSPLL